MPTIGLLRRAMAAPVAPAGTAASPLATTAPPAVASQYPFPVGPAAAATTWAPLGLAGPFAGGTPNDAVSPVAVTTRYAWPGSAGGTGAPGLDAVSTAAPPTRATATSAATGGARRRRSAAVRS